MENLKFTGHINMKCYDADGKLAWEVDKPNLVVTAGKNALALWLTTSQSGGFMPYIGLGTGATAAASGDTALQTELATRVAGSLSSSTNVWTNTAVFGAGVNTGTLTEAGLFSASSGGTMFARQTFTAVAKSASQSITFTWQVTIS